MDNQSTETYLNHPTFGLLYRICAIEEGQELFTTLYAQRMFFKVTINDKNLSFDLITRSDARLLVEQLMRKMQYTNALEEYKKLQRIYKTTF